MPSHIRLMETLEESGNLDRRTEGLGDNEALNRRVQDGRGLTRPELAVLLSSGKLMLQDAIEKSYLPADPCLSGMLLNAFPEPMQDKFSRFIEGHRLAREIVATKLSNRIINRLGIVHPFELAEEEGVGLAQVAAAFALAARLFDLDAVWERLENAAMSEDARLALFDRAAIAVRGHMADLLRAGAGQVPPSELADRLGKHVAALAIDTEDLLGERISAYSQRLRTGLLAVGAPAEEAAMVTHLVDLDGAVGIADLAAETGIDPRRLVGAFTRIGSGLGLDWAQSSAALMSPSDPWERLLVAGLARDFQQMRFEFLGSLARQKPGKADPLAAAEEWAMHHQASISVFRSAVARAEKTAPITPAMLAQIASQARNLLAR
jgi:glutamate dehydrogenase